MSALKTYLPGVLPAPTPENDGLDKPYWEATRRGELMVQRCSKCGTFQWGRNGSATSAFPSTSTGTRSRGAAGSIAGSGHGIRSIRR